jgi:hypothetical protein
MEKEKASNKVAKKMMNSIKELFEKYVKELDLEDKYMKKATKKILMNI